MSKRDFPPIHPGEILREEFLIPLGISQYRLAKEIHVPTRRISPIGRESRKYHAAEMDSETRPVLGWYAYKDEAYKEIAREWCEDHGISWQE